MTKEEFKPIDVSKYTVTESGNVIKGEEKKTTKEELEKEAAVFADYYGSLFSNEFETFYKAFIKVAEPREKRIAELEDKLANADYQLEGRDNEIRELKERLAIINLNGNIVLRELTKAKEIINTFLGFAEAFGYSPSMDKFISDTEQFLNEVENVR